MICVDANVLLDLFADGQEWKSWSTRQVGSAAPGRIVTSHIAVAEASSIFASADDAKTLFGDVGIRVAPLSVEAPLLAGRAHRAYRRAGGPREAILADFLIGGHAAALGATLVTRDRQRFASYFPELTLITPETHP